MSIHWIVIVSVAILAISIILGYITGFLKTIFSMVEIVLAIVLVMMLSPITNGIIQKQTTLRSQIQESTQSAVVSLIEEQAENGVQSVEQLEKDLLRELVPIPAMRGWLQEKIDGAVTQNLDVEGHVAQISYEISNGLTDAILSAISIAITLIVVVILLQIVRIIITLIGSLPVISTVNQMAGGVLGLIRGVVILWLIGIVLMAAGGTDWGKSALQAAFNTPILSVIYRNNLLFSLVMGLLK